MQRPYSFASTLEKKKQHKNQEVRQVVGIQHEDIGVHAEYKHYICVSVGGGGAEHMGAEKATLLYKTPTIPGCSW